MHGLKVVRDIAVVLASVMVCWFVISDRMDRATSLRTERARLSMARAAIDQLDTLYQTAVFDQSENKGIYQQIFRQNEISLEYQKLLLTMGYTPAPDGDALPTPPSR